MKPHLLLPLLSLLASCVMPGAYLPSRSGADLVLPLHFRADAPHVNASINRHRPVSMLLDTGASVSVIESNLAAMNEIAQTGRGTSIKGIHGSAAARQGIMRSFDLGPWHTENVSCYIRASTSQRPGGLGSAILGIDHLRRSCSFVTYDYRARRVELGFGRSFIPNGSRLSRTPFRWVNGLPMIRVSTGGISWDAVVDTGSSWGIVIDQSTAAQLGQARGGLDMGRGLMLSGVGGSVRADQAGARIIRGPAISLCGQTYADPQLYVMPGPKRIGSRFWHGGRMTLDFRTGTLWLER